MKKKLEDIFDKEKELESELIQIVYQYKGLVKSSIFNQNSQINLTFWPNKDPKRTDRVEKELIDWIEWDLFEFYSIK